jgi:hypothetical protein
MIAQRAAWEQFVRDHAGRYLYAGAAGAFTPAGADPDIEFFLERLRAADLRFLTHLYYLLRPEVQSFFVRDLKDLLRSLTNTVVRTRAVSRGGIRGKLLWSETLRARAAGRADPATYVVVQTDRTADVPENQLLRSFLGRAHAVATRATELVGTSTVVPALERIRRTAELGLKHPYLRDVADVTHGTTLMRRRALRHRNRAYARLSGIEALLHQAVHLGRWASVVRLLEGGWYAPISDDDMFELYVLLRVLRVLEFDLACGAPQTFGLISRNRLDVARFNDELGCTIRVLFDKAPLDLLPGRSRYSETLDDYVGFAPTEHRPDICIEVSRPGAQPSHLIIEVKRTEDDQYKRDSVYKVFGYVYDFATMWRDANQHPKAVLVVPDVVQPVLGGRFSERDVLIMSSGDDARLTDALRVTVERVRAGPVGTAP